MKPWNIVTKRLSIDRNSAPFKSVSQFSNRAESVVRAHYVLHALVLASAYGRYVDLVGSDKILPLWPVFWIETLGVAASVQIIMLILTAGVVMAVLAPFFWGSRGLCLLGMFLYTALINSFGKINHGYHVYLYVDTILLFLPALDPDKSPLKRRQNMAMLFCFAGAQAAILGTYFLAGFWKVYHGVGDLVSGSPSVFSLDSFSYLVADRLLQTRSTTMLGAEILEYPFVGWILMMGAIYMQTCSLIVVFRPNLHRIWGVMLISFHLGNIAFLGISFPENILVVGLFLCLSPFDQGLPLGRRIVQLPGLLLLLNLVQRLAGKGEARPSR